MDAPGNDGRRILVSDDSEEIRLLVRLAIESAGLGEVVGEAADGDQTRRLVDELRPDLVVLDLLMPRFDGVESLRRLHEQAPGLRVLVHSGSASPELAAEARTAGAVGMVVKGAPLRELVEAVSSALDSPS